MVRKRKARIPAPFVQMTPDGAITIPKGLREQAPATELYEVTLRDDGVFELRPRPEVAPDQAWFWTPEWQAGERDVDENYAAGRWERFDDAESFLADLKARAQRGKRAKTDDARTA